MTDRTDHLIDWLRDAHAMELQAEKLLKTQVEHLLNYPALRARLERHLEDTCAQQRVLEATLQSMGSETSSLKDLSGRLHAFAHVAGTMTASDEVIQNAIAGYAFANREIATYSVLIATATLAGDDQVRHTCEELLVQEIALADWLLEHIPQLTQHFIARSETPHERARR